MTSSVPKQLARRVCRILNFQVPILQVDAHYRNVLLHRQMERKIRYLQTLQDE